ncbi:MAG TPA: citrate synthase [Sphingobacteriaceae bacterium]|nr:citrate synthase [Sphingobacteriaceae bacterium]
MSETPVKAGLEGVIAGNSSISWVDGQKGRLIYRGYDIHDLAEHASFEEVVYLLWYGKLPTRSELEALSNELKANRQLPDEIWQMMRLIPRTAKPMEVLRTLTSAMSAFDTSEYKDQTTREANLHQAIRLTASMATIVAGYERMRKGLEPVAPDPELNHAANFLYMVKGERPDDLEARAFDMVLVLHADHEFNASTFAARVTAATLSDMYSAITSAIGALKGPLHGGANEQVLRTLKAIGEVDKARQWVIDALGRRERIMGFGHRVYKTMDPRAIHLKKMSQELGQRAGDTKWYEMSEVMEKVVHDEKGLYPNVDFYAASVYHSLGLESDVFTPIFAVSRVAGWTAHVLEQHGDNRLIRPRSNYVGDDNMPWVPLDQRG